MEQPMASMNEAVWDAGLKARSKEKYRKNLARNLRESASTFEKSSEYALPSMESFIRRHIKEIRCAADELEE